jgi:hypothetical protein
MLPPMRCTSGSIWLAAALGLVGCGDDSDAHDAHDDAAAHVRDGAPPDAAARPDADGAIDEAGWDGAFDATVSDAATLDAGDALVDAARRDSGFMRRVPTNVSFETAKRLEPDAKPPLQDVIAADQIDYYVFAGTAGEFYEITTDRASFSPDLVVSLYDAERTLIAQNDDGSIFPGDGFDARLVVRLPADGDYYIEVEDRYTPAQFFASDFALLFYHVSLRALRDGTPGVGLANGSEPSAVSFALDERTGYLYTTLLGTLGDEPGTFQFTAAEARALIGRVLRAGSAGNGSSATGGEIEVVDAEQHVIAHIDLGAGQVAIDPPIDAASYRVLVKTGGTLGDNPFYALDLVMLPDNPREQNEADNGVLAGAEAVVLEGQFSRRGLVLVTLAENDVDYFKLDALALESFDVVCEGESGGSGVRGMTAELRDDADQVIASGAETASANLRIEATPVDRDATYYLRLTSTTPPAADGTIAPWARCAVIITR